jgi:hypothetical protein
MLNMGGVNNETQQELAALRSASAGGLINVGSGINYAVEKTPYATAAGSDIQISAFP